MGAFDKGKSSTLEGLGGPDRSKQGCVDEAAWPFILTINGLPDYYTTSSCAGRINVFKESVSGKKHEAEWLFVTHDPADYKDVLEALRDPPLETLWFRMECPIFHVACRDCAAAERLLRVCQSHGWKRSGIISTGGRASRQRRVMLEIVGNERIDTPIAMGGRLLFDEKYVRFLVQKANEKLAVTRRRLEGLREAVNGSLSARADR
ncbi:hypothetical protein JXA12_01170 [Candidatus Woesearchaeota archaeon]|nr:hypothetical protein [Candidatus Woesearchaeota archaeon]